MTDAFKRRDEIQVKKVPHPLTIKQLKDTPATKDQGVRENYFIKDINGMWSPPSPQASYSAFTHDPPQPSSPTLYESLMNQSLHTDAGTHLLPSTIHYSSHPAHPEWIYLPPPPTIDDATVSYQEPFYSKSSDVPDFPPVFSNKEFKVPCTDPKLLKEYITKYTIHDIPNLITRWTPSLPSPTWDEVKDWTPQATEHEDSFQLNLKKPKSRTSRIKDTIDYFSLEIHVNTIDDKLPDPETDPVQIVFWCLKTDDEYIKKNSSGYHLGIITLTDLHSTGLRNVELDYVHSEHELFDVLISKIRRYDPDMLVGYELQASSWGYLINRSTHLNIPFLSHLSRIRSTQPKFSVWGSKHTSMYHVTGRHLLNVWRLMKSEINSTSYTLENMVYHFLHKRVPHHSHRTLSDWVIRCVPILKYRATQYYLDRVQLNLELLEMSQVVQRTCECARVLGIEFGSVLSRGSQYRVESVLFRLTKPENFMLISPSRAQVGAQRSLECLPLVMEPETQYYSSPMVVLDFQSLYPSVMIAYNYCYSTCLGRVPPTSTKFGVTEYSPEPGFVHAHKDQITVSPNGIMFVKPEIRKSILATMLTELIETRIMVKKSMKYYNEDPGLLRILDAKQLTLKLLANVTYGYTSASFSGRMPCVEIADSIVKTGREILERSIQFINDHPTWGARVVYGDTDSMFVYFEGKTRQEAFKIGRDIAHTITLMNPAPIKLKFEKVYHPAVLLAKKRYVGFKYSEEQDDPVFEAKGIETVRRDGTPATQRILESSLKILFRTQDMSELKEYLYTQWSDILSNRVPLQEFIIAKEVRMGSYAGRGPNGAIVAQAQMNMDGRAEPQYGERVPYVVVYRGPTDKLKDKVVSPVVFLNDNSLRLDAEYYIRKQIIPPLARVFSLIGIDVMSWYDTMPRRLKLSAQISRVDKPRLIDQYYASTLCVACKKRTTDQVLCVPCQQQSHITLYRLITRRKEAEDKYRQCLAVCSDCSGVPPLPSTEYVDIPCDSLDCPFFYTRLKAIEDMKETEYESIQNKLGQ
ncbi:hypothetical protein BDB01DRAFT_801654 [Pilobolus umbonatus]|nr:hypothetical protein BDB01DRAFT_801654 [Pilobolus umbonatus]